MHSLYCVYLASVKLFLYFSHNIRYPCISFLIFEILVFFSTFVYFYVCACQDKVWESVFFQHVGPWDQTQIIVPGGKCLYLLGCLAGPLICVFILEK